MIARCARVWQARPTYGVTYLLLMAVENACPICLGVSYLLVGDLGSKQYVVTL